MKDLSKEELFVLQLFGLEKEDVQSVSYVPAGKTTIIDITLVSHPIPCPNCSYDSPKIKNYVLKKITHSQLTDRSCTLHYHARRYICPVCGRTYYERNPFVFKSMKISIKTVYNILEDLKDYNETFSSVAKRYYISPTSAASIFDSHVQVNRKTLPKMINFDEVYAFKSKESKYVCVLLDYQKQVPIDVLNSRRLHSLIKYFQNIPYEERKNVEICCSDMYMPYKQAVKATLPNARMIVDHFHVSQELHRRLDSVRIRTMKGFDKDSDGYYILKKFNWMLFKSFDSKDKKNKDLFEVNTEKKFNYHFHAYLNYYDIREKLLALSPELTEAYYLKDAVVDFYNHATKESAKEQLDKLIVKFLESPTEEMKGFGCTLSKWKTEIINSFIIVGHDYQVEAETGRVVVRNKKMNNAIIENRNSIIKCIKKNANGYTNWDRFRNRLLYVLDKDVTYLLYPLPKEGGKKND